MTGVVDSHIHLLPGRLGEKVRSFFAPFGSELAYPADHAAVRAALAQDGIDTAWTLPYAHKPGVAPWLNEQTAVIAATPGLVSLVGAATVHPGDDDPVGVVAEALDHHGLSVLKLHCSVGDFDADDPRLDPVWQLVAERAMPVVVHVGHGVDGQTHGAELEPIDRVATRHPDVRLIIAHCAFPAVTGGLDLIDAHANVYADLTPVAFEAPTIPIDRLRQAADRLLFGSDAPNVTIRAADHLAALCQLDLDPEQLASVLSGNARRLVDAVDRRSTMTGDRGL